MARQSCCWQVSRQEGRKAGRKAGRQAGQQAFRQAGRLFFRRDGVQPGDSVAVGLPARGVGRPHVPGAGHGHSGAHPALPSSTGEDTLQGQG